MTQRNPMNERYQIEDRSGKTRKSAASVKPATKAAASVRIEGASAPRKTGRLAKAQSQANRKQGSKRARVDSADAKAAYYDPGTPEYKKWRRIWWISIVVALVLTALSFAVLQFMPENATLSYVLLGLGYAFLIASIVVDLGKVRKIRKDYRMKMVTANSKSATAERKEQKAAAKKEAEAAAAAQARQPQKDSILSRLSKLFGKGGSSAVDDQPVPSDQKAKTDKNGKA
jgi:hypothetical protein